MSEKEETVPLSETKEEDVKVEESDEKVAATNSETTDESKKRPADSENSDENPKKQLRSENDFIVKMLCPFWCVGAVIGSGGENIKKMKEETGCSVKISKNFENFPTTNERVVSFKGDVNQIKKLILDVQNKIRKDNPPTSAPKRDNSKRKGYLKLVVATYSAGRVIGKSGVRAKQLQTDHDTKLNIMKSSDLPRGLNESMISITADNNEKIDKCMEEVVDIVKEETTEPMSWNVDYKFYHVPKAGAPNQPQFNNQFNPQQQAGGYGGYGGYPQPGYGGYSGYTGGYPGFGGGYPGYGGGYGHRGW